MKSISGASMGADIADIDNNGAQEGLSIGYAAEQFSASFTAFNDVGAEEEASAGAGSEDDLDFELAIAFTGLENITFGGGFQTRNAAAAAWWLHGRLFFIEFSF